MATSREKLTENINAIEIVLTLGNKVATPEERESLKKYNGFGDLKCILADPQKPEQFSNADKHLIPLVQMLHNVLRDYAPNQYDDYLASLKASILTSFYTPQEVINSINSAFSDNRYTFSNILDPSAGNGAFTSIRGGKYTLVEKDLITGKILAALNPDKNVIRSGFEDVPAKMNNSFNLVTSNIPFGDFKVFDASYVNSKNPDLIYSTNAIHTYFFEKGLDVLRNGGILAFIAPTGVMDARSHENFRKHILSRAHLVSAVRLPENTFDSTKAQSDFIILQKNNSRTLNSPLSGTEQLFIQSKQVLDNIYINGLYSDSNTRIMATQNRVATNMYGQPDIRFNHEGGVNGIAKDLLRVISSDIRAEVSRKLFLSYHNTETTTRKPVQLSLFDDLSAFVSNTKIEEHKTFEFENKVYNVNGSFQIKGNDIGISNGDQTATYFIVKEDDKKQLIEDYVKLRDSYFELKYYENENLKENSVLRVALNRAYENFINTPFLKNISNRNNTNFSYVFNYFVNEPSIIEIKGLEILRDGKVSKSDFFFEPVAFGKDKEVYTPQEALHVCRNRYNTVNLDYLQTLTKMNQNDILNELQGQIFKNPVTFQYETSDVFLSGNVIEKYFNAVNACKEHTVDYELMASRNALQKMIPSKIPFHDIGLNLGERWIPTEYYSSFASSIFQVDTKVNYNAIIDQFDVSLNYNYYANKKYSVKSYSHYYSHTDVLRFALLDTIPEMTKTIYDGTTKITVPDTEGIEKMNAAILTMQNDWINWCNNLNLQQKNYLENIYNIKFNCFVRSEFDGSFQIFPDLDLSRVDFKELYPSQKDAILRLKCQNGGIIDHEVGGGKTVIFCISAYEMKRLGICNKPLIIGMKANTMQIAETFKKLYPDSNVLYATEKEFNAKNRENFLNKIQNNNWDCIIMTHEQFKAIPQSDETIRNVLKEELYKIDESLKALEDGDVSYKRAQKDLEKAKQNRFVELKNVEYRLLNQRDNVIDFKNMGIDHIFCDESHKFKNTSIKTKHTRVAGIGNTKGSDRSMNLKMAIRTIQERNKSDLGATFVSGTTIVNSLTELYSLFDYLRPQALEKQGIMSFDAWASIYTKKTKEIEFSITNELQLKERFREFVKVPELSLFYGEITDFKTANDIGLDRPEKNEILVALEQTEEQQIMYSKLKEFAKTGNGILIDRPSLSNNERTAKMLIATNTAKKAAIDLRLINDKKYSPESSRRTQAVANKTFAYYNKYNTYKGTQFIFSDIGVDKGEDNFSVYADIKQKLVEMGVPEKEIQFIQDFNSDQKRQELFKQVNDGDVRILIGSTEKLGTGVNAQERCIAIHHVNIPWTPKDFEQRNGRGIRTGNRVAKMYANNKVDVLIYATKETLDTYQFNLVQNKSKFISQIKSHNISVRSFDEGGMDEKSGMSYADYIAVLSGNTELLEKAKLEREIMQYKTEERVFFDNARNRDLEINKLNNDINNDKRALHDFAIDMKSYKTITKNNKGFPVDGAVVNGKKYYDFKSFGDALNKVLDKENRDIKNYQEIGKFGNFQLIMIGERMVTESKMETFSNRLFIQGNLKYQNNNGNVPRTAEIAGRYPISALERIENNLIPKFTERVNDNERRISEYKKIEYDFPNKSKLEAAQARLNEIKTNLEKKYGGGRQNVELSFERHQKNGFKV
jgi:N12 class adenine-specific DNA methylase